MFKHIIPRLILPFLLLGLGLILFKKLKESKKPPQTKPVIEAVTQVEIIEISPATHQPSVTSFGTVQPHFETTLTPQVDGLITQVSDQFEVGKQIRQGTPLVWIDERSYNSLLIQQQAALADAELVYETEKVTAEQMADDWTASGRDLANASDFVLRKPQIKAALAQIESMKASVRKAKADLARTVISSPFDAIVTSRTASVGNLASAQQAVGTLISTAKAAIHIPLNPSQTIRLDLSQKLEATLTNPSNPDQTWKGTVTRIEPTIGEGQTTTAIIEVTKPFADPAQKLAIGLFVNAEITSIPLTDTLKIPATAYVNDSFFWALDENDTLHKITAQRIASAGEELYLKTLNTQDLAPPYRIISRPLTNFHSGQKVALNPS